MERENKRKEGRKGVNGKKIFKGAVKCKGTCKGTFKGERIVIKGNVVGKGRKGRERKGVDERGTFKGKEK